ncbi:MAG: transposase, partial [Bacteroidota bacterium]|nr:transposase [Bacteroidota bacterium]
MGNYNPNIHHRRSIRLKGYDYSQVGLYFVTICVKNRECLFGHIGDGEMILNDAGQMIESEWLKLPERFTNIELHEYIVMPNHFHAILQIVGATLVVAQNDMIDATEKGQPQGIAPTQKIKKNKTVGDMVGAFESI